MSQEKYFDQIEAYLAGTLSNAEKSEFELQLKSDPELSEAVENYPSANEVLDVLAQKELKSKLKTLQAERGQKSNFSLRKIALPLAATLILGVMAVAFFGVRGSYSNSALVAGNLELYPANAVRGSVEVDDGIKAYSSKNYSEAIRLFEGVSSGDPLYTTAQFYLGNIYLESGLAEKAIKAFTLVMQKNDSRFAEASQWYLGLAQLDAGKEKSAAVTLSGISSNQIHPYKEKADKILTKMKSTWRNLPGI